MMNLNDMIGLKVTAWILNQSQENLTPGTKIDGILQGVDQGTFIILRENGETEEFITLPVGLCRLSATKQKSP